MAALGWLVLTSGCTGTPAPPAEDPEPVEAVAPATPRPLEIPTTPPMSGEPIAGGGARADAPAPGAPPADARDFQPVSIPLGPREGGGVRWDNVKTPEGNAVQLEGGEVYDPNLPHD
jgi:hypothetical protein